MSEPLLLTDEYVYGIAPDGKSAQAALDLVRNGSFRETRMVDGGSRLEARCKGSDPTPYLVRIDLRNRETPMTSCDCSSHKRPCKHALGLLFLAIRSPETFEGGDSVRAARRGTAPMESAVARKATPDPETAPADVEEALLQSILAEPEDDAARLIYADWLEEHGRPEQQPRAEFIRVQIALANLPANDPQVKALSKREKELWKTHKDDWLQALPELLRPKKTIRFHRGFYEELNLTTSTWSYLGVKLFARNPIFRLRLSGTVDRHRTGALAVIPDLARIRVLDLSGCHLETPRNTLQILFGTPFLSAVHRLEMRKASISSPDLGVLLASPLYGRLRHLDLAENAIGLEGARNLASVEQSQGLKELSLAHNPLDDAAARALAGSPHLVGLTRLDLRGIALKAKGRDALVERFGTRVLLD